MPGRSPIAPVATTRILFRDEGREAGDDDVALDLSVAAFADGHLWVASDELSRIDRLTRLPNGDFGRHRIFPITDVIALPKGEDGEMDIEGIDIDGGYLWIVGSHSHTRRKPDPADIAAGAVGARLRKIKTAPNRYFLGCVPLVEGEDGGVTPAKKDRRRKLRAAALPFRKKHGNTLAKLLAKDTHIGRFVGIPAKENGFDIEGLAVRGGQVFLGLRGPVLRGWAIVVEIRVGHGRRGRLELQPVGGTDELFRKHFLKLGGLGIRELLFDGDDLLILAGPTMDLDGPVQLWRWTRPPEATSPEAPESGDVALVCDLPHGDGQDHAEGLARVPYGEGGALLVVYDSPDKARLARRIHAVTADLFAIDRSAS